MVVIYCHKYIYFKMNNQLIDLQIFENKKIKWVKRLTSALDETDREQMPQIAARSLWIISMSARNMQLGIIHAWTSTSWCQRDARSFRLVTSSAGWRMGSWLKTKSKTSASPKSTHTTMSFRKRGNSSKNWSKSTKWPSAISLECVDRRSVTTIFIKCEPKASIQIDPTSHHYSMKINRICRSSKYISN